MRKRYNHKEVMKLNAVASILKIDFSFADELMTFMNEKTPQQRYEEMIQDEKALRDPDMLISDKRNEQVDLLLKSLKEKSEALK